MSAVVATPELAHKPSSVSVPSVNEKEGLSSTDDSSVHATKQEKDADVVVGLFAGHSDEPDLDSERARHIRNKLDRHMLPLLFILYTLQFLDKNSLGATSILGILQDGHLTNGDFNNLSSAFYGGYILFVLPHAFLMQYFPIGKYIATNIFFWAILLGMQCLCTSYGAFFACRFLLGASEGCITSGIMTIISMFYKRVEIGERIAWTFQCNGVAAIISGFIAFGVYHIPMSNTPAPWQWFMIIISILSLLVSILFFWRMPDNPASARFLLEDEKLDVVKRIRITQNGIESKVWKKYQFIEAFKDPKSYIFFLFAGFADLVGGLGVQYSIIIKDFGFTYTQTTLLNIPTGCVQIISITAAALLLRKFNNSRTIIGASYYIFGVVGSIVLLTLPLSNKVGLLINWYLVQATGAGFVMMLSLCAVVTAGHTKKMTVNGIYLVGYALGQIVSTQFWKVQYRPRNTVPWAILLMGYCMDAFLVLLMRWHLQRQNRLRDAEKLASGIEYEEYGYVDHVMEDGTTVKVKIPIQYMDITDFENKAFRYAL